MTAARRAFPSCARALVSVALLLAACVQLPPTPQDLQAKKFEAVADKAVIYVVRDSPDHNSGAATIRLGDDILITTYPGTYFRWEIPPGTHCITGYAADIGTITLRVEAGRIYFVKQQLGPFMRFPSSHFYLVNEPEGRAAVQRSVLVQNQ